MTVRMDMELSAKIKIFGMMPLPGTPMNNSRSSLKFGIVWLVIVRIKMENKTIKITLFFKYMNPSLISNGYTGIYAGFNFGIGTLVIHCNLRGYGNIPDYRTDARIGAQGNAWQWRRCKTVKLSHILRRIVLYVNQCASNKE